MTTPYEQQPNENPAASDEGVVNSPVVPQRKKLQVRVRLVFHWLVSRSRCRYNDFPHDEMRIKCLAGYGFGFFWWFLFAAGAMMNVNIIGPFPFMIP